MPNPTQDNINPNPQDQPRRAVVATAAVTAAVVKCWWSAGQNAMCFGGT